MNTPNTPLFEAVERYVVKNTARFHMPGHKGILPWFSELAKYDITEVDGCDSLYQSNSAIAATERGYSEVYQSAASFLSAGGSTLCIQAMLSLAVNPRQKLVCGRGCHVSAINAMAVLDASPVWIFPEIDDITGLSKAITARQVGLGLDENPDAAAVYITSPDYYGLLCDVKEISEVCHTRGVPLLVDNAHGAHLRFLDPSKHPINLGADMCADSLHKTLPVLTGGAMLHIKNEKYLADAKRYMSVFGSTSPSYLIMLSADMALESLEADFPEKLRGLIPKVKRTLETAKNAGFLIPDGIHDPARLTLGFSAMGYTSDEFMRLLRESGIEPEMVSDGFAVLMTSPWNPSGDFTQLEKFISALPRREPLSIKAREQIQPLAVKSLRESVFAPVVEIPLENALGRVVGSIVTPCPPGVPVAVPGELVDVKLMLNLKSYGISWLNVLK